MEEILKPKQDYKKLSEKFKETLTSIPDDVLIKYTQQETLEGATKFNLEKLSFPELVKQLAEYYNTVPLVEKSKQEQETCNFCSKTLREQMKGCGEISCYRQFLTKKETLEEFAIQEICELKHIINSVSDVRAIWIQGAKWQQERMYSEEDMIEASKYGYNFHKTTQFPEQEFEDSCIRNTHQWLTQFKKK